MSGCQAGAEGRTHEWSGEAARRWQARWRDRVAHRRLPGLPGEPSWPGFLLGWLDMLQLTYVATAYLGAAALGLLLAAGGSRPAAWLASVLAIPFVSAVLPDFLGVARLRRGRPTVDAPRRRG